LGGGGEILRARSTERKLVPLSPPDITRFIAAECCDASLQGIFLSGIQTSLYARQRQNKRLEVSRGWFNVVLGWFGQLYSRIGCAATTKALKNRAEIWLALEHCQRPSRATNTCDVPRRLDTVVPALIHFEISHFIYILPYILTYIRLLPRLPPLLPPRLPSYLSTQLRYFRRQRASRSSQSP
jgi:hypothetical protein